MSQTIGLSPIWEVGGGDSTQRSDFFHHQRGEETSIKMPRGSGSTAPRVCVTVSRRPLIHFGSHVVAMISASKCASCADKHRVRVACPALHSDSAHGMVCSYATGGNGDRGTHSTSVHLKYNCVHYDLNND